MRLLEYICDEYDNKVRAEVLQCVCDERECVV